MESHISNDSRPERSWSKIQSSMRSSEVRAALDGLRRIVQALRTGGRSEGGRRSSLPSAQLFALQQIAEHPSASINDLAALTFTHQSSVSVVIQRLVERKLVRKITAKDDRRRQALALTAGGRRLLGRAPVAMPERLIAAIRVLPPGDRKILARSLTAIAQKVAPQRARQHPAMFFEDGKNARRTKVGS